MIVNRIGTFFMLLGGFLLLLFIFSAQSTPGGHSPLFLWGAGSFFLGVFLWFRNPRPPGQPAERFRMFRRVNKKGKPGANPDTREKDQRSPRSNSR